jgi:RNA polymerase sigma factor (sigma-70 family)
LARQAWAVGSQWRRLPDRAGKASGPVPSEAAGTWNSQAAGTFWAWHDNRVVVQQATPISPSDGAIIAASRAEPQLFSTIFDRHFAAIHRYLARRAGVHTADDLASLTFVVALERRSAFRVQADDARPWLYGIATNLLRAHRRAGVRRSELEQAIGDELRAGGGEDRQAGDGGEALGPDATLDPGSPVGRALARLDPDQCDALLLYAWAELSYEQIAVALAVPVGTVRSRLARARAALRLRLEPPASPHATGAPTCAATTTGPEET